MANNLETVIHLVSGGLGGTAGAVVTCPLEVIKTRLQSSINYDNDPSSRRRYHGVSCSAGSKNISPPYMSRHVKSSSPFLEQFRWTPIQQSGNLFTGTIPGYSVSASKPRFVLSLREVISSFANLPSIRCFWSIVSKEGFTSLWKGLGPNLVGVAPSRAIYFCVYSKSKATLNRYIVPDTPIVHMLSAGIAGFTTCTITNPVWVIKTRLQLDRQAGQKKLHVAQCVRYLLQDDGLKGFYRGVTASYVGISETIIHFMIYEALKAKCLAGNEGQDDRREFRNFLAFMLCAGTSKCVAATLAYPHELARTRMRQKGHKYVKFLNTLSTVVHEEGFRALYKGLSIHLLRQIPNTAVMMGTYELTVHVLKNGLEF